MVWKFEVTWSKLAEAEAVPRRRRGRRRLEAGVERLEALALDEAEGGVAERRRDREEADLAAAVVLDAA